MAFNNEETLERVVHYILVMIILGLLQVCTCQMCVCMLSCV